MIFVFFGSNQLSVMVLDALYGAGYIPELVITVPDDAVGRKHVLTPPFIKQTYGDKGLRFYQPASLKEADVYGELKKIQAEVAVVAAYRKFIPENILKMFPHGVLNVHPSLLPKWRGPSPIQSAIWHGDSTTGVSIILLDNEMDHGPVIAQEQVKIEPDEYFIDLYSRLGILGGQLLVRTIGPWLKGEIVPVIQDHQAATFSQMIKWENGEIDCRKSVGEIYNQIRALSSEPGCWIRLANNGLVIKILKVGIIPGYKNPDSSSGIGVYQDKPVLFCADGALMLEQVQPQGKRPVSGREFLNGYGQILKQ